MLLGNFNQWNANPGRAIGGSDPHAFRKAGTAMAFYLQSDSANAVLKKSSFGNGYQPPYSWILAPKAGGMAAIGTVRGVGAITAALTSGSSLIAALGGSGSLVGTVNLITSLSSALTGTGSVSGTMTGTLALSAALAGSGNLTASLKVLAYCVSSLTGSGAVQGDLRGTANLEANISPFTELSPENMATAVWNAVATLYNSPGTMGEKANSAASAGDPWTTALPGAYASGSAGDIIGNILNSIWSESLPGSYPDESAGQRLGVLANSISGSAALNTVATGYVLTTGIETGSYLDTQANDSNTHVLDDVGNEIDGYYEFNVGIDGIPVGVSAVANLQSGNDTVIVYAWNWASSAWEQRGVLPGSGNSNLSNYDWTLLSTHVGTGADSGMVRIRFAITSGGSNPRLDINALYVQYAIISRSSQATGVAQGGTATSITLNAGASSEDDFYKPSLIVITSGTGSQQSRRVDNYDGTTRVATVATPWITVPDSTSTFTIIPWGTVRVSDIDADPLNAIRATVEAGDLATINNMIQRLYQIRGLVRGIPATATPDSLVAGDIELEITGDGETSSTMTRTDTLDG